MSRPASFRRDSKVSTPGREPGPGDPNPADPGRDGRRRSGPRDSGGRRSGPGPAPAAARPAVVPGRHGAAGRVGPLAGLVGWACPHDARRGGRRRSAWRSGPETTTSGRWSRSGSGSPTSRRRSAENPAFALTGPSEAPVSEPGPTGHVKAAPSFPPPAPLTPLVAHPLRPAKASGGCSARPRDSPPSSAPTCARAAFIRHTWRASCR